MNRNLNHHSNASNPHDQMLQSQILYLLYLHQSQFLGPKTKQKSDKKSQLKIDKRKEEDKTSTRNIAKIWEPVLEMQKIVLIILVDLTTVTQKLLEGDSTKRHGFQKIELGSCGRDSTIETLDERG